MDKFEVDFKELGKVCKQHNATFVDGEDTKEAYKQYKKHWWKYIFLFYYH